MMMEHLRIIKDFAERPARREAGRNPVFLQIIKDRRVQILKDYYDRVEEVLEQKAASDGLKPKAGFNKKSPVSLWIGYLDADEAIGEAGLVNPLFKDFEK